MPASIVKGTPFEERVKGPGVDDRVAIMDKMGIDVAAISVNDFWWWDIKDQGLARAVCQHHNETLAKAARDIPTGSSAWRRCRCSFRTSPSRCCRTRSRTARAA